MATSKRFASLLVVLALAGTLAACGSSSSKSSRKTTTTKAKATTTAKATVTTQDIATVNAAIAAAYDGFLSAPDAATKLTYVEKGTTMTAVITKTTAATAKVALPVKVANLKATVEGTKAKFTWDLAKKDDGSVILKNQSGEAAYVGGKWLITRNTICDLATQGAPDLAPECLTAASS